MFCLYELATGTITQVTTVHDGLPTPPDGLGLLELAPGAASLRSAFWVSEGRLLPRRVMDLPSEVTLAVGEVRSFALPAGATVVVGGEAVTPPDGVLEIEGGLPSTYAIEIAAPGWVDVVMTVTVEG